MKIEVSDKALKWFKEEVDVEPGSNVRFFPKIYGDSAVQEGYSLAFTIEKEVESAEVETTVKDITFFIYETDLWFFKDYDLYVGFDEERQEVKFEYKNE